ncbi:HNH/ENDO VII family nuclease [Bombella sp. TMW 2.2543]|uniref:HNH/ENDO VII family nuclease n=1 Tax=Bombella pluederhausensis TaxID=2967336 RepID=A0ABT3WJX2_9PROT|nr:HNH/ENDO VII family nuclease [Bombella pluederhausensis]MCX5618119.1 HNH/ENDO VII family nuclease [Bombella pluederhausensis]
MMNHSSIEETVEADKPKASESASGRHSGMLIGGLLGTMVGGPEGGIIGGLAGGVTGGTLLRVLGGEAIPDALKAEIEAVKHDIKVTTQEAAAIVKVLGLDNTTIGKIITSLSGIGEASVYAEEGLKGAKVGNEVALIRPDIDMNQVDPVRNWTNAERMERGLPPLTPTGEIVELHQIGQKPGAPYAEITGAIIGNINTAVHLFQKASGMVEDVKDFGVSTYNYWRDRVDTFQNSK